MALTIIDNNSDNTDSKSSDDDQQIIWCGIACENEILVQAGDSSVAGETTRQLLIKEATPGFEYHSHFSSQSPQLQLKGVKFHIYETADDDNNTDDGNNTDLRVWVYCAVYDSSSAMSLKKVKAFIENMIQKTELQRKLNTGVASSFHEFAGPIILKEMQAVSSASKKAVREQLDAMQERMRANVKVLLDHDEQLMMTSDAGVREARSLEMMRTAQYGGAALAA
jgi:hypothetical protein